MKRVLVVVRDGIAEVFADEGVKVAIFDWDNFSRANDTDRIEMELGFGWTDLADPIGVPTKDSPRLFLD